MSKSLFSLLLFCFATTSASASPIRFSDVATDGHGNPMMMNQAQAKEYCTSVGGRLPSIRELAEMGVNMGAQGISDKDDDNSESIKATNLDGSKDHFFYTPKGYRPRGSIHDRLWSSSSPITWLPFRQAFILTGGEKYIDGPSGGIVSVDPNESCETAVCVFDESPKSDAAEPHSAPAAIENTTPPEQLAVACSSIDPRKAPIHFKCSTSKGVNFERVSRDNFGEAWEDNTDGTIWSAEVGSATQIKAIEMCKALGGLLPSRQDYESGDAHGFFHEIVFQQYNPYQDYRFYWTSSAKDGFAPLFSVGEKESGFVGGSLREGGLVRCIGH